MLIIAGPNGAGKSTLYREVIGPGLPEGVPFINADIIQRDELKDASMEASYQAAEIAEARRREHLATRKSFVAESTFSHPSKLALVADAKAAGFRVAVFHVNVRNASLSVARVSQRFQEGGHNVPKDKILERYERNQPIIRDAVLQADKAYVYDNSVLGQAPVLAIKFTGGNITGVADNIPAWASTLYAAELASFSRNQPPARD